jgi:acyl-CoA thioester hydrolase
MDAHEKVLTDLSVRFRDIDSMGHVNNAVFLTYFEEGRKAFLEKVLKVVDPADYPFILAHIRCDFLRPVRLGDRISLEILVGEIGDKSFKFKYRIVARDDPSVVYGKGESVMVLFDYQMHKTMPIPKGFLDRILRYCDQKT